MSKYIEHCWPDDDDGDDYVKTVSAKHGSVKQIETWCLEHGAITVEESFTPTTKIVVDYKFIDFYDEEMYIMFKLTWG